MYDGNNSCYLDVTLTCLALTSLKSKLISTRKEVHTKSPKLQTIVKEIMRELKRAFGGNLSCCTSLRRLFKAFDAEYQKAYKTKLEALDWRRQQQEPRDVFNILMRVFDIQPSVNMTVNNRTMKGFFNAPYVAASDMNEGRIIKFEDYFPINKGVVYGGSQTICFNVERNFLGKKVQTLFEFPYKTGDMYLAAVIIHNGAATEGGHYTAMIRQGNSWYHYDDIGPKMEKIGSFMNMISWNNNHVKKNCTILVYDKQKLYKNKSFIKK